MIDQDARVGYKSKPDSFFGYKTEFTLTTDERIITAVRVYDGAYVDGSGTKELCELTIGAGIDVKEFYGDKAFFRKPILDLLKEHQVQAYIPVSESVYRIDEDLYKYNKDSDQWLCDYGNVIIKKKKKTDKKGYETISYYFEKELCRNCPNRSECIKKGRAIGKILTISINTPEFYEYSQRTKTQEFKEKYKNRACHEWKNAEIKRFHGMSRAKGYGLRSMSIQAKLTALAVNLKRIAALVSSLNIKIFHLMLEIRWKKQFYWNELNKVA
ncbi:MAG: transposase [Clostridia bacterium]|nr:transposase [Clostridia bacterium]